MLKDCTIFIIISKQFSDWLKLLRTVKYRNMSEICYRFRIKKFLCRCGNDVIDSILNCSAAEAKKQQIYFQYEVNFTAHIPVAPVDLCAILGNQIENALEANRQIADISARYVKIMLTQKKGFLIFRVENASAENPFSESGALKTRKEDGNLHGLGIKNIQDTVNKYNGWLKNSYDNHTFISEVLLCVSTV